MKLRIASLLLFLIVLIELADAGTYDCENAESLAACKAGECDGTICNECAEGYNVIDWGSDYNTSGQTINHCWKEPSGACHAKNSYLIPEGIGMWGCYTKCPIESVSYKLTPEGWKHCDRCAMRHINGTCLFCFASSMAVYGYSDAPTVISGCIGHIDECPYYRVRIDFGAKHGLDFWCVQTCPEGTILRVLNGKKTCDRCLVRNPTNENYCDKCKFPDMLLVKDTKIPKGPTPFSQLDKGTECVTREICDKGIKDHYYIKCKMILTEESKSRLLAIYVIIENQDVGDPQCNEDGYASGGTVSNLCCPFKCIDCNITQFDEEDGEGYFEYNNCSIDSCTNPEHTLLFTKNANFDPLDIKSNRCVSQHICTDQGGYVYQIPNSQRLLCFLEKCPPPTISSLDRKRCCPAHCTDCVDGEYNTRCTRCAEGYVLFPKLDAFISQYKIEAEKCILTRECPSHGLFIYSSGDRESTQETILREGEVEAEIETMPAMLMCVNSEECPFGYTLSVDRCCSPGCGYCKDILSDLQCIQCSDNNFHSIDHLTQAVELKYYQCTTCNAFQGLRYHKLDSDGVSRPYCLSNSSCIIYIYYILYIYYISCSLCSWVLYAEINRVLCG